MSLTTKFPAVMIDLETLGQYSDAAIIQIGIVGFTYEPGGEIQQMKVNVDPGNIHYPFSADWSTIKWWLGQSQEARESVSAPALSPEIAALSVVKWFDMYAGPKCDVWANGAPFDIPILVNLLRTYGYEPPFKYYRVQEMRTLRFLLPNLKRGRPGVAHDAGADARAQAEYVVKALKELRAKNKTP